MIELESQILLLSGLNPTHTKQTFTMIEIEGSPYRVRTVYYTLAGNDKARKTLVLTHGYMSNCTTFVTEMAELAKYYNLVLFDNCGWGLNTRL
jgi:pimeloyl-ACP methyl ester carboxylesterase